MANYKQIRYGDTGSEVTDLQKLLNGKGYQLEEDGIFGNETRKAVEEYQQKNNLTVDGIAGDETWGSLSAVANINPTPAPENQPQSQPQPAEPSFSYDGYTPSDTVTQAQALLNQQLAQMPGPYQSQWQGQMSDIIGQILNRQPFSYDVNKDALYQQYAQQYAQKGRLAMMDTVGQAQAMTGGYGNSYAQAAGQQAYQGYLQELNEVVPELYGMAQEQYNQQGQDLMNQYAMMAAQEEQEYGRYQDQLNRWQSQVDAAQNRFDAEREYDYSKWANERDFEYDRYMDEVTLGYQQERDQLSDAETNYNRLVTMISQLGYAPTDEELAAAGMTREQADAYRKAYAGGNTKYVYVDKGEEEEKTDDLDVDIESEYLYLKQSGEGARNLDAYLKAAVAEGLISKEKARELREKRY